jgi:hypothetical protein
MYAAMYCCPAVSDNLLDDAVATREARVGAPPMLLFFLILLFFLPHTYCLVILINTCRHTNLFLKILKTLKCAENVREHIENVEDIDMLKTLKTQVKTCKTFKTFRVVDPALALVVIG